MQGFHLVPEHPSLPQPLVPLALALEVQQVCCVPHSADKQLPVLAVIKPGTVC